MDAMFRGRNLAEWVADFEALCLAHSGPVAFSAQIERGSGPHLVVCCVVHGDEIGPLPAAIEAFRAIVAGELGFSGRLTIVMGNPRAVERGTRFTEQDLNRVFVESAPPSFESERARELMPLLRSADLVLDLHQTIRPVTEPFYTFAYYSLGHAWARALEGASAWVTRRAGAVFAAGSMAVDEYAVQYGVPAVTLELGQKGFSDEAFERGSRAIRRAASALSEVRDTRDLELVRRWAAPSPELRLYKRVHAEPFGDPRTRLREDLANFTSVKAGEVLGQRFDGNALLAPCDGRVLFPKFPPRDVEGRALPPVPSEIYALVQEASLEEFQ